MSESRHLPPGGAWTATLIRWCERALATAAMVILAGAAVVLFPRPPETPPPLAASLADDARIVIHKKERRLVLLSGGSVVRSYPVALGQEPQARKQRRGDGRTPEGRYHVVAIDRDHPTGGFIQIDYPKPADVQRAWLDGILSRTDADAILTATARRRTPPRDTPLGGPTGIHGGSKPTGLMTRIGYRVDWTPDGSIALTTEEIRELLSVVRVGMPVEILP